MHIEQFKDYSLSHYSYAIVCGDLIALVDPSRNPLPYYKFAEQHKAKIVAVIETHPHADFVSSHLQIHKETGAKIYVSKFLNADYPHETFDDGDEFNLNHVNFSAINTPGHSPDSICVLTKDTQTHKQVLFSGDTLFVGNVGRPDLRENSGDMKATRISLAKDMYHSIQNKFNPLDDDVIVYPAHGAGSLCGKNMSNKPYTTLGNERITNWAFKKQTKEHFVEELLSDQPFVPSYFGFNVELNKAGADDFMKNVWSIPLRLKVNRIEDDALVVDVRNEDVFKSGHLPNSVNIMARSENDKFETWLGSVIEPNEKFHIVIQSVENYQNILERVAKIGYESQILSVVTLDDKNLKKDLNLDLDYFKSNTDKYTVIDIRNESETKQGMIFENALHYPLDKLRASAQDIATDKPIVVHCAAGYRSATGYTILNKAKPNAEVYDLSFAIEEFKS
ncbi:MBL fold metallo-hydrolase [Psychroflexus sp. MBR-150]|jgi:glyoxylase-like metal-dependent hydrolase (beta-lactamase superfamily II)/rhodanese-related sulfurtransferase